MAAKSKSSPLAVAAGDDGVEDAALIDIELFSADDAEAAAFVRARLEKEVPHTFFTVMSRLTSPSGQCVAFTARLRNGPLAGLLVLDTECLAKTGRVCILWLTVLFVHRGQAIGRRLVAHAEAYAQGGGAAVIEAVGHKVTGLFQRRGYRAGVVCGGHMRGVVKQLHEGEGKAAAAASPATVARPTVPRQTRSTTSGGGKKKTETRAASKRTTSTAKAKPPAQPKRAAASGNADDADDRASRKVSRKLTTQQSQGKVDISSSDLAKANKKAQWFSYNIPDAPASFARGEIIFRMARPSDKREWCTLLLAACHYNMGGTQMMSLTLEAACRIVAVKASDDKTLVGLIAMQRSGWVSFIACDEEHRSEGVGSFLLFLAMEWLRVRNGTKVSLTPLSKKVMAFYYRWAFHAYPAEDARKGTSHSAADVVMERNIDAEVLLLPEGRPLKHYITDYSGDDEVVPSSTWYYYFYQPPSVKAAAKKKAAAEADTEDRKRPRSAKVGRPRKRAAASRPAAATTTTTTVSSGSSGDSSSDSSSSTGSESQASSTDEEEEEEEEELDEVEMEELRVLQLHEGTPSQHRQGKLASPSPASSFPTPSRLLLDDDVETDSENSGEFDSAVEAATSSDAENEEEARQPSGGAGDADHSAGSGGGEAGDTDSSSEPSAAHEVWGVGNTTRGSDGHPQQHKPLPSFSELAADSLQSIFERFNNQIRIRL